MGNPYLLIMSISGIVILSFFFNILAKKTNVPAVLMLIVLGMGMKVVLDSYGLSKDLSLDTLIEVLCNVGLVMIILESSLVVKREKQNAQLMLKALLIASVGMGVSLIGLTLFFLYIFPSANVYSAVCYAIPLSIMGSAIILPSIGQLQGKKREFMKYESTFSNIIGIVLFSFMAGANGRSEASVVWDLLMTIVVTVLLSIAVAFCLVYLFQRLQSRLNLFLLIGVLALLFAVGNYFHVSSLLLILAFGVLLNNTDLFFRRRLTKLFDKEKVKPILRDFKNLTLESAFFIRTFFFVLLGFSITLSSLYDWRIVVNSMAIVGILYLVRFIALRIFAREHLLPELFIAPRGLVTLLLFFILAKNDAIDIPAFVPGLLLYPIIITSILMMISLILHRGETVKDVLLRKSPISSDDDETMDERINENTERQNFNGF